MEEKKIIISNMYEMTLSKEIAEILLQEFPEKIKLVEE